MRTIDIWHKASPKQLERYATLYHFRYDPQQMEREPIKSRPDHLQTSRAIASMNKEAGQIRESKRRHNYREDLDPEKLDWHIWLSHNWKWYIAVNRTSGVNSTQWLHQQSAEAHASGKPRSIHWWWSVESKLVDNVLVGEIKMEVERRSLFFFSLTISHPRSGNYCVSDGVCAHTPCRTRTLLTHFPCVAHRHRAHAWLKVFAVRMSYLSISPSPFSGFMAPSLLFPNDHFETTLPTLTSAPSLPNCSRSESAGLAHFRTSGGESGYLADPTHSTGYEPKEFDKITSAVGDTTPINDPNYDDISDFSKITRENTGLFGVSTIEEASVSHGSHFESKDSMHREAVAWQREKKEKVLWSVLQSRCPRKVDGTASGVILFRLTENSILMNEISGKTWNEVLNKPLLVKIQLRGNYIWLSATWRFRMKSEEFQKMHWLSRDESLNLEDDKYWKPINGQIKLIVREIHLCSELEMKNRLHQECYAISCQEGKELRRYFC